MELKVPHIDELVLHNIKKEKYREIINDPEILEIIKEYNFTEREILDNLYYFSQYLNQRKLCRNCKGIEYCNKNGDHLIFKLKIDNNKKVTLGLTKCDYQYEVDKIKSKFTKMQFEEKYLYKKLKNCLDYFAHERQGLIKKLLEFKNNPNAKSVYTYGSNENGKSYILTVFSVFLAKLETTKEISFISAPDEFKSLEELYSTDINYFDYLIEEMQNVQYLFIDDLGKENFKTKFSVEKILLPIITYRNEKGLPTFITSKYSPTDLVSVYGYGKETKSFIQEVAKTIKNNYSCILLEGLNFSILK